MAHYQRHNYRLDWTNAKQAAHLDQGLFLKTFTKKLGAKLDNLNTYYDQAIAATNFKAYAAAAKKHSSVVKDIKAIVPVYRKKVVDNGNNRQALGVLDRIFSKSQRSILDEMGDDLREKANKVI